MPPVRLPNRRTGAPACIWPVREKQSSGGLGRCRHRAVATVQLGLGVAPGWSARRRRPLPPARRPEQWTGFRVVWRYGVASMTSRALRRNSIGRMMNRILCLLPPVPLTVMVPALKTRAMTPWSRASPSTRLWFSSRVWRLMNPSLTITRLEVTANSVVRYVFSARKMGIANSSRMTSARKAPPPPPTPAPTAMAMMKPMKSRIPGPTKMPQCSFARWRTCSPAASSPSEKSGCRGVEGMMGRASNQWSRR